MIFSRLLLNPQNRAVQRDLADVYQLHRTVMSGFPEEAPVAERVLFRLDESAHGRLTLLVQSRASRPDWGGLPDGYLLGPDPFDPVPNPAVREDDFVLRLGQALRFRLRANPTVKKSGGPGKQGQRVGIVREEAQLAWLARKGAAGGFRLLNGVNVADKGRAFGVGRKPTDAAESARTAVELLIVQFDGLLEVTDPALFGETLLGGIGSGKGFGCGLLSLARS